MGGYARNMTATPSGDTLLGIYLNDHLAGSIAGAGLSKRLAGAEEAWAGDQLRRLAAELEEDRTALRDIMAALGVPVRHYKLVAAWAAERAGRVKPNGALLTRSPLSRVVELEALRLGIEGKAAGWRTLRARAEEDSRLDTGTLDDLITRAGRQIDEVERLRMLAVAEAFSGTVDAVDPDRGSGTP
jgi:hypothetical protein